MRRYLACLMALAVAILAVSSAFAGTLENKKNEWAFKFSYTDADSVGKETNLDLSWQYIIGKGYHEVGAVVNYFKDDPDVGASLDATAIGPKYTWNWTPANDKATGFVAGSYAVTGGDLGDSFDAIWEVNVGAKMFVGNSAAITADFFFSRAMGANGVPDQDSKGIAVGISIFTHGKK